MGCNAKHVWIGGWDTVRDPGTSHVSYDISKSVSSHIKCELSNLLHRIVTGLKIGKRQEMSTIKKKSNSGKKNGQKIWADPQSKYS